MSIAGLIDPPAWYRYQNDRQIRDFAARIVIHSGKIILKVTQATWKALRFRKLCIRNISPPVFART